MDFSEVYEDTCSSVALACRSGQEGALKVLIQQGKTVNQQDNRGWRPIHEAAFWGRRECLEILLATKNIQINAKTFEGETALFLAVKANHEDLVKVLIENKADVNEPNNEDVSPLHLAAARGLRDIARLLISNNSNLNVKDWGLSTPLHEAAIAGHFAVVELLLENGADASVQDCHGRIPLFCAAESSKHACDIVKLLLSASTPSLINKRASDGGTSVMLASQTGCFDCVRELVERGGDPSLKANDNVMAVHLALTGDHKEVLKYLLQVTDHSVIEQSCVAGMQQHFHFGRETEANQPVNIFHLAMTYDRLHLVDVLVKGGLKADNFIYPWELNRDLHGTDLLIRYRWSTPLSFLLCRSPLDFKSIEILLDSGSSVEPEFPDHVPPLVALVLNPGWSNPGNSLAKAIDTLLQKGASVYYSSKREQLPDVVFYALAFNPQAFLHFLRKGYIFQNKHVDDFLKFAERLVGRNPWKDIHSATFALLSRSGLYKPFTSRVPTLKELGRLRIHQILREAGTRVPIKSCNFPFPLSLVDYLCWDDVFI